MGSQRVDWRTPLNIPAGTVGRYSIEIEEVPPNTGLPLNSIRAQLFGGQKGYPTVSFPTVTRWHHLKEDGARWMCDWPIEQRQHDACLRTMQAGSVLVGGLGIGYAATVIARRKKVHSVTVVEISPEVVELVGPHLANREKINIITGDLLEFLRSYTGRPFLHAFYDIWRSDRETTLHQTVIPLHQLSAGKVRNTPVCWNEDVMRGQLCMALQNRFLYLQHPDKFQGFTKNVPPLWEYANPPDVWIDWAVPFWQWYRTNNPEQAEFEEKARLYSSIYGLADWQALWQAEVNYPAR